MVIELNTRRAFHVQFLRDNRVVSFLDDVGMASLRGSAGPLSRDCCFGRRNIGDESEGTCACKQRHCLHPPHDDPREKTPGEARGTVAGTIMAASLDRTWAHFILRRGLFPTNADVVVH